MLIDSVNKLMKNEITNAEFMLDVLSINEETYNWALREIYLNDNDRLIRRIIRFYCLDDELNITEQMFKLLVLVDMRIFDVWVKDFDRIITAIEYYKNDDDDDVRIEGLKKYGNELGILLKDG